jgi:hypothetical protein
LGWGKRGPDRTLLTLRSGPHPPEPHRRSCVKDNDGGFAESPSMTVTETYSYRGYEIVPRRQWANWCVSIYATQADLPLMTRSTLKTLAPRKEEAVAEAKQKIDRVLARCP